MIAIKFILRFVMFLVAIGVLALMIAAVVYVSTWALRLLVDFLDAHFAGFMAWLRSKLPRRRRKRKSKSQ